MTKKIRIENGDTSGHSVDIEIWDNDELIEIKKLDYPTALEEITIWEDRYIVIREVKRDNDQTK